MNNTNNGTKKIVLAYSGGLDTSYAIGYLKTTYQCEVIALLIDLGEAKDLQALDDRAIKAGASKCHVINGQEEFAREYLSIALKSNALYEGVYPLISALSRALISKHLVRVAQLEGAFAVAHGCTAKGNDQIRFDLSIRALDPDIRVIAPLREHPVNRSDAIAYVEKRGIDIPVTKEKPYSIDMNVWGRSCECGALEDPWAEPPADAYELTTDPQDAPDSAEYIEIEFSKGLPTTLNAQKLSLLAIITKLNSIAGTHGVGRIDHLENRVVGIKSREIYESPAAMTLIAAHKSLEGLCLTRDILQYKEGVDSKVATMVYEGMWFSPLFNAIQAFVDNSQEMVEGVVRIKLYKGNATIVGKKSSKSLYDFALSTYNDEDMFDHESAAGFIKLWGLPLEIYANKKKQNTQDT